MPVEIAFGWKRRFKELFDSDYFKATLYSIAAISRLMTSVHSNLAQSHQYALLKTTSQRHCIINVRHDHGYGLDAVTWIC
jgi:hypothetical protein